MERRGRGRGGRGRGGGGKGAASKQGNTQQQWWKAVDEATVDPITLEPIAEFSVEPFRVGKTLFDGEMLAHYMVSTAVFAHPTTRENITREDCVRLDDHLRRIGVPRERSVTDAYDVFCSVSANTKRKEHTDAMRREATLLFQQLFTFRTHRQERLARKRRDQLPNGRPSSGLVIVDDDEEFSHAPLGAPPASVTQLNFDRDFPELFPAHADFVSSDVSAFERTSIRGRRPEPGPLVTPAPRGGRGGGAITARISTPLDVEDETEDSEEEVPLFEPETRMMVASVEEEPPTTHPETLETPPPLEAQEVADDEADEEERRRQALVEAQLRALRRSNQQKKNRGGLGSNSLAEPVISDTTVASTPAKRSKAHVPLLSNPEATPQTSKPQHQQGGIANANIATINEHSISPTQRRRVCLDGTTKRGPCLFVPIVVGIAFIMTSALFAATLSHG